MLEDPPRSIAEWEWSRLVIGVAVIFEKWARNELFTWETRD